MFPVEEEALEVCKISAMFTVDKRESGDAECQARPGKREVTKLVKRESESHASS